MPERERARETTKRKTHRYHLVISEAEWNTVKDYANKKGVTNLMVLKQFINLGLLTEKALENGGKIIIREGDKEKEIILI